MQMLRYSSVESITLTRTTSLSLFKQHFSSTTWKTLRHTIVNFWNGVWKQPWNRKKSWWYRELNWSTCWAINCAHGNAFCTLETGLQLSKFTPTIFIKNTSTASQIYSNAARFLSGLNVCRMQVSAEAGLASFSQPSSFCIQKSASAQKNADMSCNCQFSGTEVHQHIFWSRDPGRKAHDLHNAFLLQYNHQVPSTHCNIKSYRTSKRYNWGILFMSSVHHGWDEGMPFIVLVDRPVQYVSILWNTSSNICSDLIKRGLTNALRCRICNIVFTCTRVASCIPLHLKKIFLHSAVLTPYSLSPESTAFKHQDLTPTPNLDEMKNMIPLAQSNNHRSKQILSGRHLTLFI